MGGRERGITGERRENRKIMKEKEIGRRGRIGPWLKRLGNKIYADERKKQNKERRGAERKKG